MPNYWEIEWRKRVQPNGQHPAMNIEKMAKIIYELTIRPEFANMEKLEIGCGTAIHASHLANIYPGWRDKYTGIDLSETAVRDAKGRRMDVICGDFFTHEFGRKFDCFLFLDSLEHIFDHDGLAERIKKIAANDFCVFGNVPLYVQKTAHDEKVERPVGIGVIKKFCKALELSTIEQEIYGIDGLPYMRFTLA